MIVLNITTASHGLRPARDLRAVSELLNMLYVNMLEQHLYYFYTIGQTEVRPVRAGRRRRW